LTLEASTESPIYAHEKRSWEL